MPAAVSSAARSNSSPMTISPILPQVPAIYAKLVDIDKVDILLSPYGTNVAGPILPFAKERDRLLIGMFVIGLNAKAKYDRYFSMGPWGPDPAADLPSLLSARAGQRSKEHGDLGGRRGVPAERGRGRAASVEGIRHRRSSSTSATPPTQPISAACCNRCRAPIPDIVYVCSYPTESAAIVRGIDEIGLPDSVQLFGGGMVGIQNASLLDALGKQLDGVVNYDTFSIDPKLMYPGGAEFLRTYAEQAGPAKVDPARPFPPAVLVSRRGRSSRRPSRPRRARTTRRWLRGCTPMRSRPSSDPFGSRTPASGRKTAC